MYVENCVYGMMLQSEYDTYFVIVTKSAPHCVEKLFEFQKKKQKFTKKYMGNPFPNPLYPHMLPFQTQPVL